MRTFLLLFSLTMCLNSFGQSISIKDSMEVASIINNWNHAWNIKSHLLASKWYSEDAKFTNAFGDKRSGRKEIEALLKEVFSLSFVMSGKSDAVFQKFNFMADNVIFVQTEVIRKGQAMPDKTVIADRKTTHLRVFRKNEYGWQIEAHLISDARDKQSHKH